MEIFREVHKMNSPNLYNSPFIAMRIKERAKIKGVALKELLQDCELGANAMSHMLHGRSISATSLARIADCLDCSVDYLLGRTDIPEVNRRAAPEQTYQIKIAARGGGVKEITVTDSQLQAIKNLPEVTSLDDLDN